MQTPSASKSNRETCPLADALQNRDNGRPLFRQRIFHARRYFIVWPAFHDAVGDEPFRFAYARLEWRSMCALWGWAPDVQAPARTYTPCCDSSQLRCLWLHSLHDIDTSRGFLCRADNRRQQSLQLTIQADGFRSAAENNFLRVRNVVFSFSSNRSFLVVEFEEIFPIIRGRDKFELFTTKSKKFL